jgi:hypothetical protein
MVLSLASDGAALIIGGSTTQTIATHAPQAAPAPPSYLIVRSKTAYTGGNALPIAGGTVVSLLPGASSAVVGGTPQPINAVVGASIGALTTVQEEYVIASQTPWREEAAITVAGTILSIFLVAQVCHWRDEVC